MNTNQQTVHQMGFGINEMVKQAPGRESVSSIDMDWVSVEQLARYIYGAETGDLVSFDTNIPDAIESLIAYITAVQDLHGYDNPWPAGGGKNLFNPDSTENYWVFVNGSYSSAENEKSVTLPVLEGETYTLSSSNGRTATNIICIAYYDSNDTNLSRNIPDTDGKYVTATAPANAVKMIACCYTYSEAGNVQLEKNSSATSYAPYSNICPITGWTGCNVHHMGKNLCQGQEAGKMNNSTGEDEPASATYRTKGYIPVFPGKKYTISGFLESQQNQIRLFLYDKEKTFISNSVINIISSPTITIADGTYYIRFQASDTMMDGDTPVQVEVGESATAFEEYQGETYAFTFPDEAGTVYGVTLYVLTGVLTVDMACVDLGTLTWATTGELPNEYKAIVPNIKPNKNSSSLANVICSAYPQVTYANRRDKSFVVIWANSSAAGNVYFMDSNYNTPQTFKTAMSGVQLVYELATPVTYQLTPQEVEALVGVNNIFADTGNVSVQYKVKEDLV